MKNPERVAELLAELRALTENDFERHRLDVLEKDLTAPPTVEVIDDTHQQFNGVTYSKTNTGHFVARFLLHRDVWEFFKGEIPAGNQIHHVDFNPGNNDISNLQSLTPAIHRKIHNGTPLIARKCPACGKIFFVKETSNQICCSIPCANKIKPRRPVSPPVEKICPCCGKKFSVPYDLRKQKFCSKACAAKLRGQSMKKPPIEKICPVCGKTFTLRQPSDKNICCSRSCAAKMRCQRKKNLTSPA